jgi:hypothetical protein
MSRTTAPSHAPNPAPSTSTTPTAAQRIVAAMWTLGKPAATKDIAAAAGVGYSTATPILRNLLATDQAAKTDGANGTTEWQLTATLPTSRQQSRTTTTTTTTGVVSTDPARFATDARGADSAFTGAAEAGESGHARADDAGVADEPDGAPGDTAPTDTAPPPGITQTSASAADSDDSTPDDTDTDTSSAATTRTYRKPVQPRRPKGELRAAVLAVLTGTPQQPFKVSEVCKAIDAANADGASNKAGAGAVANALDKLVNSGDAVRIEDARHATYQAAPAGG